MAYNKTNWIDDVTPLSAQNLNNLEKQYDEVKAELVKAGTSDIKVHAKNITNAGDGSGLDAEKWAGLRWVKPGDTIYLEHLDVISTKGASSGGAYFLPYLALYLPRPGKYRFTGELKSDYETQTASVRVALPLADAAPNIDYDIPITDTFSTTSTNYVAFSLDFNFCTSLNAIVVVQMAISGTTSVHAAMKNCRIRYTDGTPANNPEAILIAN